MTRPVLARLAACLATGLVAVGLVPLATVPASAAEGDAPLSVTMSSLSPSVIPQRGTVTVTGEVTNTSDSTWTNLNVYMLTSTEPFTDSAQLAEAVDSDPEVEIGARLFRPGLYDEIGDLAPGQSTTYTLDVPRRHLQITGAPGVYWLGVHVLGANEDGRDAVADGRARTFVPLMEPDGPSTSTALVLPVKGTVKRQPDGRLRNLSQWQKVLGPEGRLQRLVDLSDTAGGLSLTWLMDPAVLDAAQSVAGDNPPMNSGPTDTDQVPDTPPSLAGSPSPSPPADVTEPPEGEEETPVLSEEAQAAEDWLRSVQEQAEEHAVLATPYGEVDLAAGLRADFEDVYEQAAELSARTMETFDVDAAPVVAPPSGYLPNPALNKLDPDTPVLLGDRAAPDAGGPVVDSPRGSRIVLSDTSAAQGGPGPGPRQSALAVRQRVLSEAAVHTLSSDRDEPLVVTLPQSWDPGPDWRQADFFAGLDVPWLRTVDIPSLLTGPPREYDERLTYPRREHRAELPLANLLATRELADTGNVYASLLTRNDTVDEFLGKSAMVSSSYRVRMRPGLAAARARETTLTVRARMGQVNIDVQPLVTMSSEEGTFQVTVVNGIPEPVTVGIDADILSDDLVIDPAEPVSLGPNQRASVRLRATAKDIGVHSVTLVPTTANGEAIGDGTKLNVRTSQVGLVIWAIMGLGAAVLVVASGRRIVRRVRTRKATHGPLLKEQSP